MKPLEPQFPRPGAGARVVFRHPLLKKIVSRGLGTSDLHEARGICRDIDKIRFKKEWWNLTAEERAVKLFGIDARAQAIFYGVEVRAVPAALDAASDKAIKVLNRVAGLHEDTQVHALARWIRGNFSNSKELKLELAKQKAELEFERGQNSDLRRKHNLDIKATLWDAYCQWEDEYKIGREPQTIRRATSIVMQFVEYAGRFEPVGSIRRGKINEWLTSIRIPSRAPRPKGTAPELIVPAPETLHAYRAYLSTFWTWCFDRLELSENPMSRAMSIPGTERTPENILATRREKDLLRLIELYADHPYWQAWIAVAVLAGPRFAEQQWLKISDVYLEENYIRVATRSSGRRKKGTKTGRERNIPIEQTVLQKILKDHVERREQEQRGGVEALQSPWLFPSMVPPNPHMPRTKSQPGQWSHARVWRYAFDDVRAKISAKCETLPDWFEYGPMEWRHCFGTALGMCGWESLEIARAMGNSEDICKRHYVAAASAGKRWGFKW